MKRQFWRDFDELNGRAEYGPETRDSASLVDRREFIAVVSASLATLGLHGCSTSQPERIVPYVRQPEDIVPGKPLFFATAMPMPGDALGILAESHMGRPTKIEGNPDHPSSMGATDAWAQASILDLYDPDRSQAITNLGRINTWDGFITTLAAELESKKQNQGEGLRILTESVNFPTMLAQFAEIQRIFPRSRWHQYEPCAGSTNVVYRFEAADVILSLDADFLATMPGHVRYARDFALRRRPPEMNRLYVLESTPSITGAMADHRRAVRSSDIGQIASTLMTSSDPWLAALARDLEAHRGRSVVVAGENQPREVHEAARRMNTALGNVGQTVVYTQPSQTNSIAELVRDMDAGNVDLLLIIGGNPVYTAPSDLNFAQALDKVRLRAHLSLYVDETSFRSHWHIPQAHYLESWGDVRSYDGTVTIMQPLINPLYGGKAACEVLAAVLGRPTSSSYEIVRGFWKLDEAGWRKALHDGILAADQATDPGTSEQSAPSPPPTASPTPAATVPGIELVFRPDPSVYDGRFANNAWLQELPRPITKLVWGLPALMSPATAQRLEVSNDDVIEINAALRAPVWISPGHADDSITLYLGGGRTHAGKAGSNIGYNAYAIRTSEAPWITSAAHIRRTGERQPLITTQAHGMMENRNLVRYGRADEIESLPETEHASLYPEYESTDYAWGMSIDLSTCIGCNACVTACQSENNIPSVGPSEVARGREMHWLRIDRYYEGDPAEPQTFFQPMLCQHCEKAPCEPVCPVGATTHSDEGLNEMTYNRCVGTRYCSNNCPYKVRRFNFFEYAVNDVPSLMLLYNPDVTVRSRGVMEKCTYCVQRINQARINAKKENRPIRDGEVVTACQGACPADAIVFGDTANPESRVSKMKAEPRNYGVLTELNTQPRTTYLARIMNPNQEIV